MVSRRMFLGLLGAGVGAMAAGPAAAQSARPTQSAQAAQGRGKRPNIVLFMVDDMGWQDTSLPFYYEDGKAVRTRLNRRYAGRTPNMERLAKEGMLFTDAYACAVCSPTRCSLMSGMNAARHRVTDWTLGVDQQSRFGAHGEGLYPPRWSANGLQPPGTQAKGVCQPPWRTGADGKFYQPALDAPGGNAYDLKMPFTNALTFPQLLQDAGYHTIHVGKAHWGSGSGQYNRQDSTAPTTPGADPRRFGFDVNIAGCEVGGPKNYRGDAHYGNKGYSQFATPGLDENGYYRDNVFLTDALTDMALRELDRSHAAEPDRPFYLYMAHYALHSPLDNGRAWDASRSDDPNVAKDARNPNPNDGLKWDPMERNYSTLIQGMDDSLGKLLDKLDALGETENTLFIFMADNGGLSISGRLKAANAPARAGRPAAQGPRRHPRGRPRRRPPRPGHRRRDLPARPPRPPRHRPRRRRRPPVALALPQLLGRGHPRPRIPLLLRPPPGPLEAHLPAPRPDRRALRPAHRHRRAPRPGRPASRPGGQAPPRDGPTPPRAGRPDAAHRRARRQARPLP